MRAHSSLLFQLRLLESHTWGIADPGASMTLTVCLTSSQPVHRELITSVHLARSTPPSFWNWKAFVSTLGPKEEIEASGNYSLGEGHEVIG